MAIGLQIAFGLRLLQPIERVGFRLWARVAPLARGLMARRGAGIVVIGLGLWTALAPIAMIVAGSGNGVH